VSRFAYFFRETAISLRRNLLMTVAGILTVAVSLFLFGGVMLLSRMVDHGTARWKGDVRFEIFMQPKAPQPQIDDIQRQLDALQPAQVKSFRYLDHDAAYRVFKQLFRDKPSLTENVRPQDLPPSFRVVPTRAELTSDLVQRFTGLTGVKTVVSADKAVHNMLTATRAIRIAFFALSGVLLASSLFLIVNTIRLATFARRREIEVMKLVGASNWFVRVPFMAEGLTQGAIGAGIAFGLVYTLKVILSNLVEGTRSLFQTFYITTSDALAIGVLVLVVGAAIGLVGSAIGLRRFLEI
jgi:cell division transport system permease protein